MKTVEEAWAEFKKQYMPVAMRVEELDREALAAMPTEELRQLFRELLEELQHTRISESTADRVREIQAELRRRAPAPDPEEVEALRPLARRLFVLDPGKLAKDEL